MRGETPQYRQLNTRQIGLFNSSREYAKSFGGLVPVSTHNVLKEAGSQPGGQSGPLRAASDAKPAKLVANPLHPGQLVKLYRGSTGRYGTSLAMQHQQADNSTAKLWRKPGKSGKPAFDLGVQGV